MPASFALCIAGTALAVAALLVAEYKHMVLLKALAKPIASAGFVALAIAGGAQQTSYGLAVLVALAFSWLGDVLLIPRGRPRIFRLGVMAFLLAHVGFIVAFALRGVAPLPTLLAAAVVAPVGFAIARRLLGKVTPSLRSAVASYIVVISIMVPLGAGTVAAHGQLAIAGAALAFYVSDLSVALDRFVSPGFVNRAWGLPLYYAAQLAFAWSATRG